MSYMPDGWTLPQVTETNRAFFTSGKLMVQHCIDCDRVQHPPEDICIWCQGTNIDYLEAKGTGVVYSYVLPHHPPNEILLTRVPYNIVLVSLDDYPHVRIVGNLLDVPNEEIAIGIPSAIAPSSETRKTRTVMGAAAPAAAPRIRPSPPIRRR